MRITRLSMIVGFVGFVIFVYGLPARAAPRLNRHSVTPLSSVNCGPKVLKHLLGEVYGLKVSVDHLISLSNTERGLTSMAGLERALRMYALPIVTIHAGWDRLKELAADHQLIIHYSENNHFAAVASVSDDKLVLFDPADNKPRTVISRRLFLKDWKGPLLVVGKPGRAPDLRQGDRRVSEEKKAAIIGGSNCENGVTAGGNHDHKGSPRTEDPIILSNGNVSMRAIDIRIPTRSIPLQIIRNYSAHMTSYIPGLRQQEDTTSWYVEDGELSGQGDRMETTGTWADVSLSVKMQTVDPGTQADWQVAWFSFNYVSEKERYMVLLKKSGILELTRLSGGKASFLSQVQTTADPKMLNTLDITKDKGRITVALNGTQVIDHQDPSPILAAGKVVMESYFCHAHFDDLKVRDLKTGLTDSWTFSVNDNDGHLGGAGWRLSIEEEIIEEPGGALVHRTGGDVRRRFLKTAAGTYTPPAGIFDTLSKTTTGYTLRSKHGVVRAFDLTGTLQSITDRHGDTTTLHYIQVAGRKRISKVVEPAGRTLTFHYNSAGYVAFITGPLGRTVAYDYNSKGQLASVTDREGNAEYFTYHPTGSLQRYTDRRGHSFEYDYFYNDRASKQRGPGGQELSLQFLWDVTKVTTSKGDTYQFEFGWSDQLISVTDPKGNRREFLWNQDRQLDVETSPKGFQTKYFYKMGSITKTLDAMGNWREFKYDPKYNLLVSESDAKGNVKTIVRNSQGNAVKTIDAEGHVTLRDFDQYGQCTKETSPMGRITQRSFDNFGNIVELIDAAGAKTFRVYDLANRLLMEQRPDGSQAHLFYNNEDRLIKKVDFAGGITRHTYDPAGNRVLTEDPMGGITEQAFNSYGHLIKRTDALGNSASFTYDLDKFLLTGAVVRSSYTDEDGNSSTTLHDSTMKVSTRTDALGRTKSFKHNEEGLLVGVIDANGGKTRFHYNKLGQRIRTVFPDGKQERLVRDANSDIVKKVNRDGEKVFFKYNDRRDLVMVRFSNSTAKIKLFYDGDRNLIRVLEPVGQTRLTYDAMGRVVNYRSPSKDQIKYRFDQLGRLRAMIYPDGSRFTYRFNKRNQLLNIKDDLGRVLASYTYDKKGRSRKRTLHNGTVTINSYNKLDQLLSVNSTHPTASPGSFAYQWGKTGVRTQSTIAGVTRQHVHDQVGQLLSSTSAAHAETLGYDSNYNRVSYLSPTEVATYKVNSMNQLVSVSWTLPAVLSAAFTHNDNGNVQEVAYSTGAKEQYTWSPLNKMTGFTDGKTSASYKYDWLGRRVFREVDGVGTWYIYSGMNLIAEKDSAGKITARYLHGAAMDEIVYFSRGTVEFFVHQDGKKAVKEVTNVSGQVVERYEYTAYGKTTVLSPNGVALSSSAIGNPFRWVGRPQDEESGLYDFRSRVYDPRMGRFVSMDPAGYVDGLNLYAYTGNSPLTYSDPLGMCKRKFRSDTFLEGLLGMKSSYDNIKLSLGLTLISKGWLSPVTIPWFFKSVFDGGIALSDTIGAFFGQDSFSDQLDKQLQERLLSDPNNVAYLELSNPGEQPFDTEFGHSSGFQDPGYDFTVDLEYDQSYDYDLSIEVDLGGETSSYTF